MRSIVEMLLRHNQRDVQKSALQSLVTLAKHGEVPSSLGPSSIKVQLDDIRTTVLLPETIQNIHAIFGQSQFDVKTSALRSLVAIAQNRQSSPPFVPDIS
jgi:hypothetical protein